MQDIVNTRIEDVVELLKAGGIAALPTETVYGIAANAADDNAVAKIYALKNRPSFNPLIIHVASLKAAEEVGVFSEKAKIMARIRWPGGLTIVVPKKDKSFAPLATAGLDTIALRVPSHPMFREVLERTGLKLAAPSANLSGRLSPTKASHVMDSFPNLPVLDGGKCEVGLESTVITFNENDEPVLLRAGVLQIPGAKYTESEKIISPGQILKHYAPKSPIRINARSANEDEVFVGFDDMACDFNLSRGGDLNEAAANLFSYLHRADEQGKKIAVAPIPNVGVGIAINERLIKAAAK